MLQASAARGRIVGPVGLCGNNLGCCGSCRLCMPQGGNATPRPVVPRSDDPPTGQSTLGKSPSTSAAAGQQSRHALLNQASLGTTTAAGWSADAAVAATSTAAASAAAPAASAAAAAGAANAAGMPGSRRRPSTAHLPEASSASGSASPAEDYSRAKSNDSATSTAAREQMTLSPRQSGNGSALPTPVAITPAVERMLHVSYAAFVHAPPLCARFGSSMYLPGKSLAPADLVCSLAN